MAQEWLGPCTVKRKLGDWTYELEDSAKKSPGRWHVDQLKEYFDKKSSRRRRGTEEGGDCNGWVTQANDKVRESREIPVRETGRAHASTELAALQLEAAPCRTIRAVASPERRVGEVELAEKQTPVRAEFGGQARGHSDSAGCIAPSAWNELVRLLCAGQR